MSQIEPEVPVRHGSDVQLRLVGLKSRNEIKNRRKYIRIIISMVSN